MLTIVNLSKTYKKGVRALDDVSLEVEKGLFGLLGPNGAAGTVRFDGLDVLADPRSLRRHLGYLPQDFGVYPKIPAFDLLEHLAVL